MTEWITVFQQIHDALIPKLRLDAWERAIYQYLLRHSRLIGKPDAIISIDSIAAGTGFSTTKVRDSIRSMHKKGCLVVDDRSRRGHVIRVLLPSEIDNLILETVKVAVDIEAIDFYSGRKYITALLKREEGHCFYCLRAVTEETGVLDHVISQLESGDNFYKNIVVACHECNSSKQGSGAEVFLRSLYREGVLSKSELTNRLTMLARLQEGDLRPTI